MSPDAAPAGSARTEGIGVSLATKPDSSRAGSSSLRLRGSARAPPGSVCPAARSRPPPGAEISAGDKRGEAEPLSARRKRDTGAQTRGERWAPSPGAAGLETFGLSFPGYERSGDRAEVWAVF